MELKIGGKYRHHKGNEYELVGVAYHSETHEEMVVYRGLYNSPEFGNNPMWCRPTQSFLDKVIVNGKEVPRFEYVGK